MAISELEGVRGLLALWVLIGHWGTTIDIPFSPFRQDLWNVQAVDVFIILSGFVITLLLMRETTLGYWKYILRRWLRIWPTFIVILFISLPLLSYTGMVIEQGGGSMREERLEIIANSQQYYWSNILLHLTMLHGLVPTEVIPLASYAFIGQAWSISLEWQFYLVAPLFFWLLSQVRRSIWLPVAVVLCAGLMAAGPYFSPAFLGNKLYLFAIGAGSCYMWGRYLASQRWLSHTQIRLISAMLLIPILLYRADWVLGAAVWVAIFHVIVMARHPLPNLECRLALLLNSRIVQFFGRISYPLYLVHFLVMVCVVGWVQQHNLSPVMFATLVLTLMLPLSVLAAYILSALIERPFMRLGKKWASAD